MAFHSSSKEVLKYLALYPVAFRFKALTAIFIINKNELPLNDPLIQNILLFDKKVLENENGLFSKHDLIFLENSFDQKLKQQIMQYLASRNPHETYNPDVVHVRYARSSACKTNMPTVRLGCITTSSGITSLMRGGL